MNPAVPTAATTRRRGSLAYRRDVDGFRGLAVALVVIFHVWMGKVSGGVDVFLSLSGFFFLGSLLRTASDRHASLNPLPHLQRLVRRIYPVLLVTVALTVVATMVLKPQTQWSDVFDQAVASILYFQNWELALTAQDYAAADQSISPLQHLWSMSVQGQFYLLSLTVVLGVTALWRLVLRRYSPRWFLAALLVAATVASTWWSVVGRGNDQSWNYYDTFARLWELYVGGVVAVVLSGIVLPWILRFITTIAGLAMVVSCGFLIDGVAEFPGPLAWYPIGGALLVLIGGNLPAGVQSKPWADPVPWFLSLAPLRKLGDISYSLYLWHWPILVFWLYWSDSSHASILAGSIIIAASVLLALISERWIERPLRMPSRARSARTPAAQARDRSGVKPARTPAQRRVLAVAAVITVLAASTIAGSAGWWQATSTDRQTVPFVDANTDPDHPGARAPFEGVPTPDGVKYLPTPVQIGNDLPASTTDKCIANFKKDRVVMCVYGDPNAERTVVLAGGSHSEHWITGLDEVGRHYGFRVVTLLKMGCPLTLDASVSDDGSRMYPSCRRWTPNALAALVGLDPDWVFTTATRPATVSGPDITPQQYVNLWEALGRVDIGVLAIRDTPWIFHDKGPERASDCLEDGGTPTSCGMPREVSMSSVNPATVAVAGLDNVRLLDLTDGLCGPEDCPVVVGNVVTHHDSHHLSATWVRSASTELARQMGIATGWW